MSAAQYTVELSIRRWWLVALKVACWLRAGRIAYWLAARPAIKVQKKKA